MLRMSYFHFLSLSPSFTHVKTTKDQQFRVPFARPNVKADHKLKMKVENARSGCGKNCGFMGYLIKEMSVHSLP
jgi:hypothetical protein